MIPRRCHAHRNHAQANVADAVQLVLSDCIPTQTTFAFEQEAATNAAVKQEPVQPISSGDSLLTVKVRVASTPTHPELNRNCLYCKAETAGWYRDEYICPYCFWMRYFDVLSPEQYFAALRSAFEIVKVSFEFEEDCLTYGTAATR